MSGMEIEGERGDEMKEYLPVAAAASEPSSLTSMNALWTTSETLSSSGESKRPLKLALLENISAIPI